MRLGAALNHAMARRLVYHPLFEQDVIEAANWYDGRSTGLGDAFISNVKATVAQVAADPDRFASTLLGVRYWRVERFPYIVLFDVLESQINFPGVLHTARAIEKWREKRT